MDDDSQLIFNMLLALGEKLEVYDYYQVDCAMLREHENDDGSNTLVLHLYPEWRGNYGQNACATMYLNTEADVRRFMRYSGRNPNEFTVSQTDAPAVRKPGKTYPWENRFQRFGLITMRQEEAGKKKRIIGFRKLPQFSTPAAQVAASAQAAPAAPGNGKDRSAKTDLPAEALAEPPDFDEIFDQELASPAPQKTAGPISQTWDQAVEALKPTDRTIIKTPEIAAWVGKQLFGTQLPPRNDELYLAALMAYESGAAMNMSYSQDNKAAHAAGMAAAGVVIEAMTNG